MLDRLAVHYGVNTERQTTKHSYNFIYQYQNFPPPQNKQMKYHMDSCSSNSNCSSNNWKCTVGLFVTTVVVMVVVIQVAEVLKCSAGTAMDC